eukprot:TRINITY_DN2055_c0_g1_i1.p1 TRINITY_DN2055_c0_g1~~TRINITY_DN2055_c0_g1_i1.p1  ORF type:complete len:246 (-),score=63.99 TRINITY_DN2055_c0_g1_i1:55-792(-)
MATRTPRIFNNNDELSAELAKFIIKSADDAIKNKGNFSVTIAGGSLPAMLRPLTEEPYKSQVQWDKWHVFFSDERFLPLSDPESNFDANSKNLFSKVPIPRTQIYTPITEGISLEDSAKEYQEQLTKFFQVDASTVPRFDLHLLGAGPDGHTASLFPGHPLLQETSRLVAPISDSPKPPPQRVTFTLPVLNAAASVAFVLTGDSKADIVKDVLQNPDSKLPSALVKGNAQGSLDWFLDTKAASKL